MSGLALLSVEVLFLSTAVLLLQRLSSRFGLGPLYVLLGANQYLQAFLASTLLLPLPGGFQVSPGSTAVFASSLFAILLIFLKQDLASARSLIYGIVIANLSLAGLSLMTGLQSSLAGGESRLGFRPELLALQIRVLVAGTILLVVDSFLIVIVYERLRFGTRGLFLLLRIVGSLLLVLWLDALAFTLLALWPASEFWPALFGQLIGKGLSAVLYGAVLFVYLSRADRRPLDEAQPPGKATQAFSILSYRERYEVERSEKQLLEEEVRRRQAAEEALRESEQRFRALSAASPVGIFSTDARGRCLYTNARFQQIAGLRADDSLGDGWIRAIHPEDREPVGRDWWSCAREGREFAREFRLLRPDGQARFVHARAAAIHSGSGERLGYVCTVDDITERRQLESLREDLTHATVHDLRNPLTSMLGGLDLLAVSDLECSAEQRELLEMARANAHRMRELVNAILDVSRLESGRMPIERTRVELDPLARDCMELQAPLAQRKGLRLERQVAEGSALLVDERLVRRVLDNLIGNAIKFTPEAGAVSVQARADERPGFVELRVQDTGAGIAPEVSARLFQKFSTGGVTGSGSGLGLAFCKLVVEAHGGQIRAEPLAAGGTAFVVVLPAAP